MIKKDISLIAMHTNFDKTHLNKYVLEKVLQLPCEEQNEFLALSQTSYSFDELFAYVCDKLSLPYRKRVLSNNNETQKIALTTGSGASLIKDAQLAGADCFLTGDIKYHDAMMARELGLNLIDIGHFESEIYFADVLSQKLQALGVEHSVCNSQSAFLYE